MRPVGAEHYWCSHRFPAAIGLGEHSLDIAVMLRKAFKRDSALGRNPVRCQG
jgi:hypothetical protein